MKNTRAMLLLAMACTITLSACDSDKKTQVQKVSTNSSVTKSAFKQSPTPAKTSAVKPQTAYQDINTAELQQLLNQGVALIDIRQADEWKNTGIIPGSNPLTFFRGNGGINPEFLPKLVKLAKPNMPVALISETGNRTLAVSRTLANQLGYKKVYNVKDGIKQWIAEGRTVASLK